MKQTAESSPVKYAPPQSNRKSILRGKHFTGQAWLKADRQKTRGIGDSGKGERGKGLCELPAFGKI